MGVFTAARQSVVAARELMRASARFLGLLHPEDVALLTGLSV